MLTQATQSRALPGGRDAGLDVLRAAAAALVVICHLSLYRGDGSLYGLKNGVLIFFALSGYLLYRPFLTGRPNLRRYALLRAARILPAYAAALIGLTLFTGDDSFVRQPLSYLFFLQNYDPGLWQGFLGVSWTLAIEVLFYISLPLVAAIVARRPSRLLALAGASFVGAMLVFYQPGAVQEHVRAASLFPFAFWAFMPGMLVALLEWRGELRSSWISLGAGIALLAASTIIGPWTTVDMFGALGSLLVLGWVVARRPDLGRLRPYASAGAAISYSVYLWHVDFVRVAPNAVVAVMLTVAVAGAIYLIVERPILRGAHLLARASGRGVPPTTVEQPVLTTEAAV